MKCIEYLKLIGSPGRDHGSGPLVKVKVTADKSVQSITMMYVGELYN